MEGRAGWKILKSDTLVAKNYLNEKELSRLNRLVTMFIDYAEMMAEDEQLMSMQDWLNETDRFLTNNRRNVLDGKGIFRGRRRQKRSAQFTTSSARSRTRHTSPNLTGRRKNISGVNDMNNQEQFAEFLHCCREQRVKRIHLAEPCLIVNSSAGDFGSILIEFEQSSYFVTSKYLPHQPEDEEIDEFCVRQYECLADLKDDDLLEADIYKTLSSENAPISFLAEW